MLSVINIVPTLILLVGVVDDVRSRKVHNWLVLALLGAAALSQVVFAGLGGLREGLFGAAAALLGCLPLVWARIIGAGDLKLMVAFGMATAWPISLTVILWSLVWGAILGLIRATVAGDLPKLLLSTYNVAMRRKPAENTLQRIPYTIALMFGWLTYLTLARTPGGLL